MIWLKRILPLVLIGVAWYVYTSYAEKQVVQNDQLARQYALLTAKVWLASATHRDDNPGFLQVRDSLFEASGLTIDELNTYLQKHESQPEFYTPYVRLVKTYVDSLSHPLEDSSSE